MKRREFLKNTTLGMVGVALAGRSGESNAEPEKQESVAPINVGGGFYVNDPQKFAEDLKILIDDFDFVLIESTPPGPMCA